jgi:hypothetical protein
MGNKKFDIQIKQKRAEIIRRRIWQRALSIAREFGGRKVSERDCYCTEKVNFEIQMDGFNLSIKGSSYGQFHENFNMQVRVNASLIFEANRTCWITSLDGRVVIKIGRESIEVIRYISDAPWGDILNKRKIRGFIQRAKRDYVKNRLAESERIKNKEIFFDDEDLAYRFGITSPEKIDR